MEVCYKTLLRKLSKDTRIATVRRNLYEFKIHWKTGVRERWIIDREFWKYRRVFVWRSSLRPKFLPRKAMWWEDLSNGRTMTRLYAYGINEIEYDVKLYSGFAYYKYSDYEKLGPYEKLLFVHDYLEFLIENKWIDRKYPIQYLRRSLGLINEEQLRFFRYRNGFKLSKLYASKERPGHKILEHFMPYKHYGMYSYHWCLNRRGKMANRRLYKAIVNLIRNNERLKKRGRKPKFNFSYDHVMANMRFKGGQKKPTTIKFRPINLYRNVLREFGLQDKLFLDIDPVFGEKALACHIESTPYCYVKTCPFDSYAAHLAEFLHTDLVADDGKRTYDVGYYDGNFISRYDCLVAAIEKYKNRCDNLLVFVKNEQLEEFKASYTILKSVPMKVGRAPWKNGIFALI